MTPFDIIKKKILTHNEVTREACYWCAIKDNITFYYHENIKDTDYGALIWVCDGCLRYHPPPKEIVIHEMSIQDIFTLKLLFPNA